MFASRVTLRNSQRVDFFPSFLLIIFLVMRLQLIIGFVVACVVVFLLLLTEEIVIG